MAKFLFYVVNLDEGSVEGTNDVEILDDVVENDQYTVIQAQSGSYWCGSSTEKEVAEIESEDLDEEDDNDD